MSVLLSEMTFPQIEKAIESNAVLLFPLGQTEQHGPHLQSGCDTIIAERVAMDTARLDGNWLTALRKFIAHCRKRCSTNHK